MRYLLVLGVFSATTLTYAKDVVCPAGKSNSQVAVEAGDTIGYQTQAGATYEKNTNCVTKFTLDNSCKKIKFSCDSFNLGKGDLMIVKIGKKSKKFKGKKFKKPIVSTKTTLITFKSNKKKEGPGALCSMECIKSAATAAPTPPPTTGTTSSTVPCIDCTTEQGKACQFPFIWRNITFTTCTNYLLEDDKPWCSTKVDQFNEHIPGIGEWGYCNSNCPSDDGYPATGSGPACQVRTTGYGYPDSCSDRLARSHKNILFLGNSFTYYHDLPGMVSSLASAAGKSASTTMIAPGGQTLNGHVTGGSLNTIRGGDWDAVVIQDQSQRPSFGWDYVYQGILPDADAIVDAIRETNPCTRPVYYLTWGKRDGDSQNCHVHEVFCSFDGIQNQLTEAYTTMAYATQPASVAPVGEAWRIYGDRNSLFDGDGSHQSQSGTYMAACVMLMTIWPDVSCVGNSYQPVSQASNIQNTAAQTVMSQKWSWPEAGRRPCDYCLP